MSSSINQFQQVCDNKCGCALHEHAIVYIITPLKGDDQVWCKDCTDSLWEEYNKKGWLCEDEKNKKEWLSAHRARLAPRCTA